MQERKGERSAVAVVVGTALLLLYCGFFLNLIKNFWCGCFVVGLLVIVVFGLFAFKCFVSSVEKPTGADTYPAKQ